MTMTTKERLRARRRYSAVSRFAFPPLLVGRRAPDGMQWIEDGAIRERSRNWADDIARAVSPRAIPHTGWYLDRYGPCAADDGKARGYVVGISHGRFLAGYRDTESDCGTCFDTSRVFACEYEAAKWADECARIAAERESEWREQEREREREEERDRELAEAHAESDWHD